MMFNRMKCPQFTLVLRCVLIGLLPAAGLASETASVYALPFSFTNTKGESVKLADFRGKPVVMTMTYTACEYACPRILQRLKNLRKAYNEKGMKAEFIVVSFDPSRDTPTRMKDVQAKSPGTEGWVFLTGKESTTRQLSMVLGIRYEKNPENGSISHDNKILILDEQGRIRKELNGLIADVSEAF